ncbi:PTS sugar transporter subunit IIB [Allocoprobacillus halotolerans]|uniref:PTS sugar transporter subunit IIB n=1 Tax=Allocoprobacillus halotolerans TaxID=2944914 RepID=A0ABY5I9L8_9FIRM|nr:PTS sugar transporter subunit IIB [Allocoprobacillus halotolerans]UTY40635.1 PTS sugar transporter subunit IIB [Allocoprobacillus halotolerans]
MIRVLLCCGGGFSSSYVAERMKKEIVEKHLDQELYMEFSPFSIAYERLEDFDIIVCCPHLNMYVKQFIKEYDVKIPIYVLPPRMYGNMEIDEIYQDVQDLLVIYEDTHMNPVHFPGEDHVLKIKRHKAYKHVCRTS